MLHKIICVLFFSLVLAGCAGNERAGIEILATPVAKVYIDGKEAGTTPYRNKNLKPGFTTLKLVWAEANGKTWEQGLKLQPFTDMVVDISLDKEMVNGYILGLEPKLEKSKAGFMLATYPDNAVVSVDGQVVGTAPLRVDSWEAGDKHIKLLIPGYKPLDVYAKLIAGYELSLVGFLSAEKMTTPAVATQENIPVATEKKMATVLKTPLGFLRVRSEPGTNFAEVKKILPGEKYEVILTSGEWVEIKLGESARGWVKSEFVDIKLEEAQ